MEQESKKIIFITAGPNMAPSLRWRGPQAIEGRIFDKIPARAEKRRTRQFWAF